MPREKRLVKSRDFERAYQKGKRLFSDDHNITYRENRLQITRVGVVVGKKFSKKAVERNRAKRVFREAVKDIYENIKSGYDIIIFVKINNSAKIKTDAVKEEIKKILEKGEMLK